MAEKCSERHNMTESKLCLPLQGDCGIVTVCQTQCFWDCWTVNREHPGSYKQSMPLSSSMTRVKASFNPFWNSLFMTELAVSLWVLLSEFCTSCSWASYESHLEQVLKSELSEIAGCHLPMTMRVPSAHSLFDHCVWHEVKSWLIAGKGFFRHSLVFWGLIKHSEWHS